MIVSMTNDKAEWHPKIVHLEKDFVSNAFKTHVAVVDSVA